MEELFCFLIRASVSIAVFFLLYRVLLSRTTHFRANRFFLLISLLISLLIATFPAHYDVAVPAREALSIDRLNKTFQFPDKTIMPMDSRDTSIPWAEVLLLIYCGGAILFLFRLVAQSRKPLQIIIRSRDKKTNRYYVHENTCYTIPFSFFNHIFIHPEYHKQDELDDILAHEEVHIHERHWIDLLIIELLTVFFWFNPFIWLFEHAIKQNHEYLADEGVLARGRSPVRYQALLVNQLMGMQVIGLTNNLTFAFGPNRLNMMNKQKTPKTRLWRMGWALPVLGILLTAFSEPRYQTAERPGPVFVPAQSGLSQSDSLMLLAGSVFDQKGNPMDGATVIIRGTTTGTVVDPGGNFSLNVPENRDIELVISFVGYKSLVAKVTPRKDFSLNFEMEREVIGIDPKSMYLDQEMPSPPPPPVKPATATEPGKEVFFVVEEMPQYPGGAYELGQYVKKKQKELKAGSFFSGDKLKGKATVGFTVNEAGKVTNIHVIDQTTRAAAQALTAIVNGMDDWSPGTQKGKTVPVDYAMELEF